MRRNTRTTARMLLGVAVMAMALTGCGLGSVKPAPTRLDLGAPATVEQPSWQFGALALPPFNEARLLGRQDVIWRQGVDGMPKRYATYLWREAPSDLVRERLFERLSAHGAVLPQTINADMPQLQVTLMQFEQVFSSDGASNEAVVSLQAVLMRDGDVLGRFLATETQPGQSNNAPAGAQALRQATDQLIARLVQWLSGTLSSEISTAAPTTRPITRTTTS